jgi:uncharacterized membrane protein
MKLTKNTETNIAGIVGAAAVVAQWAAGKFGIDLGLTADFLSAIVVLAGFYVAWKVGKAGNEEKE